MHPSDILLCCVVLCCVVLCCVVLCCVVLCCVVLCCVVLCCVVLCCVVLCVCSKLWWFLAILIKVGVTIYIYLPSPFKNPSCVLIQCLSSCSTKYIGGHSDLVGGAVSFAKDEYEHQLLQHRTLLGTVMVNNNTV